MFLFLQRDCIFYFFFFARTNTCFIDLDAWIIDLVENYSLSFGIINFFIFFLSDLKMHAPTTAFGNQRPFRGIQCNEHFNHGR